MGRNQFVPVLRLPPLIDFSVTTFNKQMANNYRTKGLLGIILPQIGDSPIPYPATIIDPQTLEPRTTNNKNSGLSHFSHFNTYEQPCCEDQGKHQHPHINNVSIINLYTSIPLYLATYYTMNLYLASLIKPTDSVCESKYKFSQPHENTTDKARGRESTQEPEILSRNGHRCRKCNILRDVG